LEDICRFKQAYNKPKHEEDIKNILNFIKIIQIKAYKIKKDLINLDGFVNMRILTKEELLIQELTKRSRTPKKIKTLVNTLNNCEEEENKIINKTLMEDVLLPKTEKTYAEFREK
jgi:hypothetical protein